MKKIIIYIGIFVITLGCGKSKEEKHFANPCDIFLTLNDTPEKNAERLVQQYVEFCNPTLRSCVEYRHNIGNERYTAITNLYYAYHHGESPKSYTVTWGALENEIRAFESQINFNCYKKYLSFEFQLDGTFRHRFISKFTTKLTCYSIPLLRGIAEKHKLNATDSLVFTKARLQVTEDGVNYYKDIIAFSVKTDCYDISDDPGKRKANKPIEPSPL